ncbi:MAG: metalloregulator ArsR/SmtB family transcription factor [Thermomicrobiales bacterium]
MLTSADSSPQVNVAIVPLRAKLFRGLADPSRLAILAALIDSPLTVGDLVAATGLSQPNASNHLSCLLDCGLVSREQRGKFAVYSLADRRIATLIGLADDILGDHLAQLAACTRYPTPELPR